MLRHEERDFAVWLSVNLELVADVLAPASLSLVERESRIETFRADIVTCAEKLRPPGVHVPVTGPLDVREPLR